RKLGPRTVADIYLRERILREAVGLIVARLLSFMALRALNLHHVRLMIPLRGSRRVSISVRFHFFTFDLAGVFRALIAGQRADHDIDAFANQLRLKIRM